MTEAELERQLTVYEKEIQRSHPTELADDIKIAKINIAKPFDL